MNKHQVEVGKFNKALRDAVFKLDKQASIVLVDIDNHYSNTKVGPYNYDKTAVRVTVFHDDNIAYVVKMSLNLTMKQMRQKITEAYRNKHIDRGY